MTMKRNLLLLYFNYNTRRSWQAWRAMTQQEQRFLPSPQSQNIPNLGLSTTTWEVTRHPSAIDIGDNSLGVIPSVTTDT